MSYLSGQSSKAILALSGLEGTKSITGTSAVTSGTGYYFSALQVVAAAVVAAQTDVSGYTVVDLTDFTSLPAGVYPCKCTSITLTSGEAIGYLARV